ncbi:MAG: PEP-CTERM sorting domain-containing protein, partial [Pseudomonadota bacterium]
TGELTVSTGPETFGGYTAEGYLVLDKSKLTPNVELSIYDVVWEFYLTATNGIQNIVKGGDFTNIEENGPLIVDSDYNLVQWSFCGKGGSCGPFTTSIWTRGKNYEGTWTASTGDFHLPDGAFAGRGVARWSSPMSVSEPGTLGLLGLGFAGLLLRRKFGNQRLAGVRQG